MAAESGDSSTTLSLRSLTAALTGETTSTRHAFATNTCRKGWHRRRAFRSHLGMPLAPGDVTRDEVTTVKTGDGYLARFRSGEMRLTGALDGDPEVRLVDVATIELVALEARDAQEAGDAGDEVYGSVSYLKPSDKTSGTFDISIQHMGPKQRIVQFVGMVYEGPFANVNLSCSLVEHDSGDTAKYREKLALGIAEAAKAGGAAAGVDAEAVGSDTGFLNDVSLGLSNLIFDAVGADDDRYNVQALPIPWTDMKARKDGTLEVKTLKRDDDPKEIQYTHRQIVNGVDDGGDTGEYGFYFMVKTKQRPEIPGDFE